MSLFRLTALVLALAIFSAAPADASGQALVVGIGADNCTLSAQDVADRLRMQGLSVSAVSNPSVIAMRSALNDFAATLDDGRPDTALIYICAPALPLDKRIFLMPWGADRAAPIEQGIVLQAFLNALSASGGTVYADVNGVDASTADLARASGDHLPRGVHLFFRVATNVEPAPIGHTLSAGMIQAGQNWESIAAQFTDRSTVLLPQPNFLPPAASNPIDTPSPDRPQSVTLAIQPTVVSESPVLAAKPGVPVSSSIPPPTGLLSTRNWRRSKPQRTQADGRIVRLQQALARRGIYPGPATGQVDLATNEAIRSFQRSLGSATTGVLTPTEIVRLLNQ